MTSNRSAFLKLGLLAALFLGLTPLTATAAPAADSIVTVAGAAVTVPGREHGYAEARCPAGYKASGGGGTSSERSVYLSASAATLDGAGWTVGYRNTAFGFDTQISAVVVCMRGLTTQVVEGTEIAVPSHGEVTGALSCPAGTTVLGGGAVIDPAVYSWISDSFYQWTPDGSPPREWRVSMSTGHPNTFKLRVVCATGFAGVEYVFGEDVPVRPGGLVSVTIKCPAGLVPLAGGAWGDSGQHVVSSVPVQPAGWQLSIGAAGRLPGGVSPQVLCKQP